MYIYNLHKLINRYILNPELREIQSIRSKTDPRHIEGRLKAWDSVRKKVRCVDLYIDFNSLTECANYFGVAYQSIIKSINKKRMCKGHVFEIITGNEMGTKMNERIIKQLTDAGYSAAVAIATKAEVEAGAACGQLAVIADAQ